jgi:hypothetical protein
LSTGEGSERATPFQELTGLRIIWFHPATLAGGWQVGEARDVRRAPTTMLVAALLLTACSGGADDDRLELQATEEPAASVEDPDRSPSPEEEPEPEDPYALPDEIDEAYVERVINAILEVQAEVLRGALQHEVGQNLDSDLLALHFATTQGVERSEGITYYQQIIDEPANREGVAAPDELTPTRFGVKQVLHVEHTCIIAAGTWDRSGTTLVPPDPELAFIFSLSRITDSAAVSQGNPTPWQWRDNGGIPEDLDERSWVDLDYPSALDHTCKELDDGSA